MSKIIEELNASEAQRNAQTSQAKEKKSFLKSFFSNGESSPEKEAKAYLQNMSDEEKASVVTKFHQILSAFLRRNNVNQSFAATKFPSFLKEYNLECSSREELNSAKFTELRDFLLKDNSSLKPKALVSLYTSSFIEVFTHESLVPFIQNIDDALKNAQVVNEPQTTTRGRVGNTLGRVDEDATLSDSTISRTPRIGDDVNLEITSSRKPGSSVYVSNTTDGSIIEKAMDDSLEAVGWDIKGQQLRRLFYDSSQGRAHTFDGSLIVDVMPDFLKSLGIKKSNKEIVLAVEKFVIFNSSEVSVAIQSLEKSIPPDVFTALIQASRNIEVDQMVETPDEKSLEKMTLDEAQATFQTLSLKIAERRNYRTVIAIQRDMKILDSCEASFVEYQSSIEQTTEEYVSVTGIINLAGKNKRKLNGYRDELTVVIEKSKAEDVTIISKQGNNITATVTQNVVPTSSFKITLDELLCTLSNNLQKKPEGNVLADIEKENDKNARNLERLLSSLPKIVSDIRENILQVVDAEVRKAKFIASHVEEETLEKLVPKGKLEERRAAVTASVQAMNGILGQIGKDPVSETILWPDMKDVQDRNIAKETAAKVLAQHLANIL